MRYTVLMLFLSLLFFAFACSSSSKSSNNQTSDAADTVSVPDTAGAGDLQTGDTTVDSVSDTVVASDLSDSGTEDISVSKDTGTEDGSGDTTTGGLTIDNPGNCFAFSLNPDEPLAIDGTFGKQSKMWQRPHDDPAVCPATALTPVDKAKVPYVAYTFCNTDSKPHTFVFEMISLNGDNGEKALDDPYLFLYTGEGFPADSKQCLAVNDDIPEAIDTSDSEITEIVVPAGGKITMVGTTFTFDPNDGTGTGYYLLVVSIAD